MESSAPITNESMDMDLSSAIMNDPMDVDLSTLITSDPIPAPDPGPPTSSFRLTPSLPSTSALMKKIGSFLSYSSSAIFLLIVFPLLLQSAFHDARLGRADFAAFYSAASFVVLTVVLSLREIFRHLYNWYAPDVQKFVVRILFMVPLYSVQSWLSLRFHGPARVYIDTLRDLYEAYVIQSFVYYLIELLGGEDRMADLLTRKDPALGGHGWFMGKLLNSWVMGKEFLLQIKHGVLQYVVVKSITTLLTTFLFLPSGTYGEGTFTWHNAYGYLSFILNTSVMYALYCLVKLFHAVKDDLRSPVNWRPVGKFLCVKGVVFFTWWQSVLIYFLQSRGFIGDIGTWSGDDVANAIIDYMVCVEMVFFAIAHMFTFTYREYLPESLVMDSSLDGTETISFFSKVKKLVKELLESTTDFAVAEKKSKRRQQRQQHQQSHARAALLLDDEEVIPCIDEDGNITDQQPQNGTYCPPSSAFSLASSYPSAAGAGANNLRTLDAPMSLREALWSSTVPKETLEDIKRLGVSGQHIGSSVFKSSISLTSMHNAESI